MRRPFACLIDAQHRQPLAAHWGNGTTSSSDAQFLRAGARGEVGGLVNQHYGQDPGVKSCTHLSDQFGPFHTRERINLTSDYHRGHISDARSRWILAPPHPCPDFTAAA